MVPDLSGLLVLLLILLGVAVGGFFGWLVSLADVWWSVPAGAVVGGITGGFIGYWIEQLS